MDKWMNRHASDYCPPSSEPWAEVETDDGNSPTTDH